MCSLSILAVSCLGRLAMTDCAEYERLESEYAEARDRMRNLIRLRQLSRSEERRLAEGVAMAIARLKEHVTEHRCQR